MSRRLIEEIQASPEYFDVVGQVDKPNDAQQYIQEGRASLALMIPKRTNARIEHNANAPLQVLVDGSDPNAGTIATSYLAKIVGAEAARLLQEKLNAAGIGKSVSGPIDARVQFWYNPTLESSFSLVPGVVCIITGNLTMFMSALAIVRERELGTIEQLLVTPMRPWELMLGKLLPYMLMGFVNIATTVMLAIVLFGVPLRGNFLILLLVSGLFMLGSLGMGLFISTTSKNQQQASQLVSLILMPNMMLSGFMYPVSNMPAWLQPITYVLPMRYYLVCVRGLMLKGNGISELSSEIIPLTLISILIFFGAVQRFHKRLD